MKRIRTVEYDPGFGWIARDPVTGEEVLPNFRWNSRSVARSVALEAKLLSSRITEAGKAALEGGE